MLIAATSKADKTADTLGGRRGRDGNKKARTGERGEGGGRGESARALYRRKE
jgi:hypothetical protein